jgi:hypothetical protein
MKLVENPQLPLGADTAYSKELSYALSQIFRTIAQKVNLLADGRISGSDFVAASIPTTGSFRQGDFIRNSAPVEAGTVGSKYILAGWLCEVGGNPGTLRECRYLTGN